jgi:aminoglycoside phosphotransferase (APT) family kinase protein
MLSVEDQIRSEAERFGQMRRIAGGLEIPELLGVSIPGRTLVYQQVEGTPLSSMVGPRFGSWMPKARQRAAPAEDALARAGVWLRRLHALTAAGSESIAPAGQLGILLSLVREKGLENSSYGRQALRALQPALSNLESHLPVQVPVALNHGDFTLPNLLWDSQPRQLWVVDFELSTQRGILHDLCSIIFDLRRHLLRPTGSPAAIARCERAFWKGYGPVSAGLQALVEALATARHFYHTLPKLRNWRTERGLWAGVKSSLYRGVFQPVLTRRLLAINADTVNLRLPSSLLNSDIATAPAADTAISLHQSGDCSMERQSRAQ